jgi:hypothetical protein
LYLRLTLRRHESLQELRVAFDQAVEQTASLLQGLNAHGTKAQAAGNMEEYSICSAQQLACKGTLMTLWKLDGLITEDEMEEGLRDTQEKILDLLVHAKVRRDAARSLCNGCS